MNLTNSQAIEILKSAEMGIRKSAGSYGRTLSADQIDDLKQSTMIRVIENWDPSKGTVEQLAYSAARNLTTDFLRGRTHAGGTREALAFESSDEDSDGSTVIDDSADDSPSALAMFVANETSDAVANAMRKLSDPQRKAISAYLADDGSPATGAQRKAYHDAIKNLRKHLAA